MIYLINCVPNFCPKCGYRYTPSYKGFRAGHAAACRSCNLICAYVPGIHLLDLAGKHGDMTQHVRSEDVVDD